MLGEHLNYNQYVVVTDRMNYISPIVNHVARHHAVEQMFDVELRRARRRVTVARPPWLL